MATYCYILNGDYGYASIRDKRDDDEIAELDSLEEALDFLTEC